MFCRNCGAKIPEGGNFCCSCGIPVKEELSAGGIQGKRPVIEGNAEGKRNDISREVRKNYSDVEAQGKSRKWIMTGVFLLAVGAVILFVVGVVGGKDKIEEVKLSSIEAIKDLEKYNTYYQEKTKEKVLYLTFDCEYENGNTPGILDTLKKHNIEAAFFVVGSYLKSSPDLIKRIVEEGHIVGNLSYSYSDMSQMNNDSTGPAQTYRPEEGSCQPQNNGWMVLGMTGPAFDRSVLSPVKGLFWSGWTVCGSRVWERDGENCALQRNTRRFQNLSQAVRRRYSK